MELGKSVLWGTTGVLGVGVSKTSQIQKVSAVRGAVLYGTDTGSVRQGLGRDVLL